MKKIIIIILIAVVLLTAIVISFFYKEEIVSDTKDLLGVRPQQYIGATVDISQVLPGSTHYIVNDKGQDLIDLASSLGMNTLRITNITSINDTATSFYTHAQWQEVLDKMRTKGMYAVVLIEANSRNTNFDRVNLNAYYLNFVKNYIITPGVCNFSNVLAVDIANEPLLNASNLVKLEEASSMVKAACPQTMITIGSWRTDSGTTDSSGNEVYYWHDPKEVRQINDIVDMISVHIYGFDKPVGGPYPDPYTLTTGYLKEIKKYTNKPIFIEEFGAGNGDTFTDQNTLGSPEIQKNAYEGVLRAIYDFKNRGVLGATAYLLYPRSDAPESWNIAKDNGNVLLPAAYTFQQFGK